MRKVYLGCVRCERTPYTPCCEPVRNTRNAENARGYRGVETAELRENLTGQAAPGDSGRDTEGIPSEAAELLSEKVRGLIEKPERLNRELEQLEVRLEFSENHEFAFQESLRSVKERAAQAIEGRRAAGRARRAAS